MPNILPSLAGTAMDFSPATDSRHTSPSGEIAARAIAGRYEPYELRYWSDGELRVWMGLAWILSRPMERRQLRSVLDLDPDRNDLELRELSGLMIITPAPPPIHPHDGR